MPELESSWGNAKGKDRSGRLFYEYVRILGDKKPKFFLAESVSGILASTHIPEFKRIIRKLSALGCNVDYCLVDTRNFGVPQERCRVIIVGYRESLGLRFSKPPPTHSKTGASLWTEERPATRSGQSHSEPLTSKHNQQTMKLDP